MKKFIVVLAALLLGAVFCFAKDPCEGYWLSIDEKTNEVTAAWCISVDNGILKGTITSSKGNPKDSLATDAKGKTPADFPSKGNLWEMPVVGTYWIYNMKQDGEGKWTGGSIVNPQDGKCYKCKITFHAADGKKYKQDTLEMRGEIGMGIGRSQYWIATDEATAHGDL